MRLFRPLDLFFASAPFRPVPRPFPASFHPGCRRFPPLPIPFLHRFQPIPSPAPPLKSTSSRPGSHPSRRHPPVLSSSSELLSLSLTAPVPACAFLPVPAVAPALAPSCVRRPVHPCQPRAVRTRGVFTHRDDFGKPACVERGLVRTAMFHGPTDVPRTGAQMMEHAGSSGNARNGSHLAEAGAADGHAGQVDGPGSSGNAENGSHLAGADAAESHAGQVDGPGSSGNTGIGSHLEATDAAEGHAGQVGCSGSSGNAGIGSHPAAADFSNEPGAVLWRHTPPHRTESGLLSYGTASPDSSVQKMALWRTRAHLGAGAARGGGSSTGRHVERMTGASGSRWRIVVAQVRRKSMRARWLQSRTTQLVRSTGGR